MKNDLFDCLRFKALKKQFLIFLAACVFFITAVYTPVYLLLSSNVIWKNSVILFLWTELVEPLMNLTFYWGAFAYVLYVWIRFSVKEAKSFFVFYGIAALARYLLPLPISFAIMSFPGWSTLWNYDIPGMLFSLVLDGLQMAAAVILCEMTFKRSRMFDESGMSGEEMLNASLPLARLIDLRQPLSRLCFWSALIPAALRLLSRLYYDVFYVVVLYGFPQKASEWALLITYYVGDVACFLIGFLVIQFLMQALYTAEIKSKSEFDS